MSSLKTQIDAKEIEEFLSKRFSEDIRSVEILKGGEISQAFSFNDSSSNFVIKVRKVRKRFRKKNPFRKEIIVSKIIEEQGFNIPVPRIIQYGVFKEVNSEKYIFSIAEKALGNFVHQIRAENAHIVDENLIDVLHQIHLVDISKTQGYGNWEEWKEAPFNSIREHVLDVIARQKIYTNKKFSSGIFEIDLYTKGSKKLRELSKFCSPERRLVHADYGYDNVLANDKGVITAVYDWEHSLFGDFVYDIAWLDLWRFRPENTYSNLYFEKFKDSESLDFKNYTERLHCYRLYIGMTAAGFFSESNQKDKYLETKQLILDLL